MWHIQKHVLWVIRVFCEWPLLHILRLMIAPLSLSLHNLSHSRLFLAFSYHTFSSIPTVHRSLLATSLHCLLSPLAGRLTKIRDPVFLQGVRSSLLHQLRCGGCHISHISLFLRMSYLITGKRLSTSNVNASFS